MKKSFMLLLLSLFTSFMLFAQTDEWVLNPTYEGILPDADYSFGGSTLSLDLLLGGYTYFENANYTSVSLIYDNSPTAYRLNSTADKLLRSILAESGIYSARITSTNRTYIDQSRIIQTQLSDANIKKWYGNDVYNASKQYDQSNFSIWLKQYHPQISNHIKGTAIDVVVSNRNVYQTTLNRLRNVKGSGVSKILPENNGVDHTEFTFLVCN